MITWVITSMESQPNTGIVVSANWTCDGAQDGFTSSMFGTSIFPEPESGYIPYANLTQTQVLEWVWTVGGVDKDATETSINNSLQTQINPPVIQQPLPWQSV